MHGSQATDSTVLRIQTQNTRLDLQISRDFLLYRGGPEVYIPNYTPMAFVGYGIIAPEYDYNDYQSLDVEGKIVVFLCGEPFSDDPNFFKGEQSTIYSSVEAKQRFAISRGAVGSIIISNPRNLQESEWETLKREFAFEDVRLAYSVNTHFSVMLREEIARSLFANELLSLDRIYKLDEKSLMQSFELEATAAFSGNSVERDFLARNVAGMIKGETDEYILLSAHYDHLGIGPVVSGDSIYNGLSDNAAGTAALLEIARILAFQNKKSYRSVLVLFTTGEEKGLLGSRYYVDHPIVPLYKTSANVNIDGMAIFDEFNEIIGVGGELSTLGESLEIVARDMDLKVGQIPGAYFEESQTLNRSDQFSFAKAGIPAILIVEGLNYRNLSYQEGLARMLHWNKNIYHTPFDDILQEINFAAARQHTVLLLKYTMYLLNSEQSPQWRPGAPFITARLRTIAEQR
jgi:hypothetical protein